MNKLLVLCMLISIIFVAPVKAMVDPEEPTMAVEFWEMYGHWSEEYVQKIFNRNIVIGDKDGNFKPDNTVTRFEVAHMINKLYILPYPYSIADFSDIRQGMWYSDAVNRLYDLGIMGGKSKDIYGGNDEITNQEFITILYRMIDKLDIYVVDDIREYSPFIDEADIGDFAKPAVESLYRIGIINGNDKGEFNPNAKLTHAQILTYLQRVLSMIDY